MFELCLSPPSLSACADDELLTGMAAMQRAINQLTALQLACAVEFGARRPALAEPDPVGGERERWPGISEFAEAEIAAALTISRWAAERLVDTAVDLARLPATAAAFAAGDLDLPRVRLICAETAHLDDAAAAAVDCRVLDRAPRQAYSALRRSLRRACAVAAPAAAVERQAATTEGRRTWVEHDGGGRSRFAAEGPTHDVFRIAAAVDAVARTLDADTATLGRRRFDALASMADTVLDDPALPRTRFGPPGIVLLAEVATLARLRGEDGGFADTVDGARTAYRPVELACDGPIHDSLAVELMEAAHTVVVPIDPAESWPCDHRLGYAVPDRLARYLAGRHPRCVFPGCAMPAHRCDWDHVIHWPDGPTCACNLVPLCRYHHRLKTHTNWRLTLHPDRRVTWTSPTGRRYVVHPDVDVGAAAAA